MKRFLLLLVVPVLMVISVRAQSNIKDANEEAAYTKVINERAQKIVTTLAISDSLKAKRVKNIIANQYRALSDVQNLRDTQIKTAKATLADDKEALATKVKSYEDVASAQIDKLHSKYLKDLLKELKPQQVDQVKDGMTYSVVPITYKGYLAMIPTLKDKEKEQIMAWLIEAREHAMDAETSDKKHAWFGKYKGRINNYLSAAGYDLKKEGQEWEKRRNAEKEAAKN